MLAQLLDRIAGKIERAEVLDKPADQIAAISEKLDALPGSRQFEDLASGTPLGHPDDARRLTALGVVAAIPALFTGHSDWSYTSGGERRIGTVHAALNNVAVSAYAGSWIARRRGNYGLGVGLSVLGGVALTGAGWLGGHLAYALGVGVDTTAFQHSEDEWTRVASADEVHVGELAGAELGGVPLVLTRDEGGAIVALAGRCTHRGGPLHEGEVRNGCIVCPWHQAEFALDGSVVHGPATRPQSRYEVELRGSDVFARLVEPHRGLRTNPIGV